MRVDLLRLRGFRNHRAANLTLHPTFNLFLGPNGAGKTNILEAVHLLSLIRSFRNATDSDMLNYHETGYNIYSEITTKMGPCSLAIGFTKEQKVYALDGNEQNRVADFLGKLKVVALLLEDDQLIYGGPSLRRRYLDMMLSLALPTYFRTLHAYTKTLKQRNAALKNPRNPLEPWDKQLAKLGAQLMYARAEFCFNMQNRTAKLFESINPDFNDFSILYKPSIISSSHHIDSYHEAFEEALYRTKRKDSERRITHLGTHRDELALSVRNGILVRKAASQGQIRAAALVLKLLMAEHIEHHVGERIPLLIDDTILDLDPEKKAHFWNNQSKRQILMTSTSLSEVHDAAHDGAIFSLLPNTEIHRREMR